MQMTYVISSKLMAVGYDEDAHKLRIQFKEGRTIDYRDVPEKQYRNLLRSSSHGKYHAEHIRNTYLQENT